MPVLVANQRTSPQGSNINLVPSYLSRLPYPNYDGTLSVSESLESPPTATITYNNCDVWLYSRLLSAYSVGRQITLLSLPFVVKEATRERVGYCFENSNRLVDVDIYRVNINLAWRYESLLDREIRLVIPARKNFYTLNEIASKAGVPLSGINHTFEVKRDDSRKNQSIEITTSLSSALSSVSRMYGDFLYYGQGIKAQSVNGGGGYSADRRQRISDSLPVNATIPCYRDTSLTWEGLEDDNAEDGDNNNNQPKFTKKEPVNQTLIKENINFNSPPADTLALTGVGHNASISGPKKTRVTTELIDGRPFRTTIETKGFQYTANDIRYESEVNGETRTVAFSTNPAAYWKTIEFKERLEVYEKTGAIRISAKAIDPSSPTGRSVNLVLDPAFEGISAVEVGLDGTVKLDLNSEYLKSVTTKGWRSFSFEAESDGNFGNANWPTLEAEPNDPAILPYQFRQVPIVEVASYQMDNARKALAPFSQQEEDKLPFSVEWVDYDDLPENIKINISAISEITTDGKVGILTPDLNYQEEYFIMRELNFTAGFATLPNPEDPLALPYQTGEETVVEVERTLTNADLYLETVEKYNSGNPGFVEVAEEATREEKTGRPPTATVRSARWEEQEGETPKKTTPQEKKYRYFINSSPYRSTASVRSSVSVPEAKTLAQALRHAETQLQIEAWQSASGEQTVAWYLPVSPGDKFNGYPVTAVSNEFTYLEKYVTTEGTRITIGSKENINVSSRKELDPDLSSSPNPTPDPKLDSDINVPDQLGEITFPQLAMSRRRFTLE